MHLTCCGEFKNALTKAPETFGHDDSRRTCVLDKISMISLAALLILGCVGAAGQIPGPTLGWAAAGMGSAYLFSNFLMGGDRSERKWMLCALALGSAAAITLGVLGGMGILSTQQVGTGLAVLAPSSYLITNCLGIPTLIQDRIEEEEIENLRKELKEKDPAEYQRLLDLGEIQEAKS